MAWRTALAYLVLGSLWILFSDRAMLVLTDNPRAIEKLSLYKGWTFVAVTALLLYIGLRKQMRRIEAEAEARARATTALQEVEAQQRLFIEHAPAALAMFDREMRYLAASKRWIAAYKLAGKKLIGVSHYETSPDIPPRWREIHRRALAGEVLSAQADPYQHPDGSVQWERWEVRPWRNAGGEVGGIVVFVEDITERIVAEGALRESEERYRLLAENVGDVVWVLDLATMRMSYVSPSIERLRGLTPEEAMAESVIDSLAPESAAMIREGLPGRIAAFQAGDSQATTQVHELRQKHRDGRWLWIETVTTLVRGRGGLQVVGVSRDIAARKRIEEELRGSETRFRSAVAAAPLPIFVQAGGCFVYLNDAAVKLFGANNAEALIGTSVLARFHAADHARVRERIRQLNEERRAAPMIEEHILRCDGSVAEVEVAAVPFRVGDKDGALVFAYDVTEQKHAREQWQLHETVLRETGEIAKVGGWSFDPATGEGFWTEEVARIHDLDPSQKASVELGLSFYTEESRQRIRAALQAAVTEGRAYDLLLEMVSAKGVRKWVRTIGHPVTENGRAVRVRGSFQDVTELVGATEALRESEGRFRELAETINEVFWITDPSKTELIYLSPAFERVWGRPCGEIYADPIKWVDSLHPEDRARIMEAIVTKQVSGEYNETYRIIRPDGELVWIRDRAFPVCDAAGKVVRIVGVAADITEKKRIEAQFLRNQRMEAIGALAGGVAHDLNNILTPVLMAASVLKDSAAGRDQELLGMIEQSARRGADIIRQLLAFSRGVEGERILLDPRHLIREMASIIRETFPRAIKLKVDSVAELWPVEANSTQLHQVLMNLCVNARDAMPAGGRLTIEARNRQITAADVSVPVTGALKAGPHVVIAVSDTGEGMSPETQARIFEPFFTTKVPGKGTGLGLSTVLGIVRSHGGHVRVYSELGKGSQFSVYLPAKPLAETVAEIATDGARRGQGELVLVVDDEEPIRSAARVALEENGYRVLEAADGEAALALAREHAGALRLVVTDLMMPTLDGIALTRQLRARHPTVAVIATSGLPQEEKRAELAALGVSELLPKPCGAVELLAAMRRVLDAPAAR
ncbi:MAG TPA: PAS domain S-box protein [Opitutaceae bacterium]|nr:PAS domain S-box protein [Opitutaceae bacterium]